MNKEISIMVDKIRVVGMLDATPECLTIHIQSPFENLKAGVRFSGCPVGDRRFASNGKLNKEAIQRGEEILKGLYLAGITLRQHPEFVKRLRRYLARFEQKSLQIQEERKLALAKYNEGKLTKKLYEARLAELQQAENQNVIERGVVFRQYAEQLTQRSGGRADIQSILDFMS